MARGSLLAAFFMQFYTYYTFSNSHALPKQSEDKTNLTTYNRTLNTYNDILQLNNQDIFAQLESFKEHGKKITLLDCGAGSGKVIDELLSGPYAGCIEKCIGISLHYFRGVAELFKKHQTKVEWIIGPAEYILPNLTTKFDLIFDVFGAYHYSPERALLIQQYHRVLKPDGITAIFLKSLDESVILREGASDFLEEYYTCSEPDTFSIVPSNDYRRYTFVIKKIAPLFPGEKFRLSHIRREGASLANASSSYKKELLAGNAWRPTTVVFKPKEPLD